MYNDISTLKIKIDALQSGIASLTLSQNSANNYAASRKKSTESASDKDDSEDESGSGDTDDDSSSCSDDESEEGAEGDRNVVERHSNDKGEWLQHSIYDQFLIDPSQLHHLQQLQQEIQGDRLETIHELNETETESESETETGEASAPGPSSISVGGEIKFISDTKKKFCPKILKSGKNKGLGCGKEANPESGFCKIHSNSD